MGFAASQARLLGLVAARSVPEASGESPIFINYRRADAAEVAETIADLLAAHFGPRAVFLDRQGIDIGEVFTARIDAALRRARVLLALIGPAWTTIVGPDGRRRLDDPRDLVRTEIERAAGLGLAIIPVLIGLAESPAWHELPGSLDVLARERALTVGSPPSPAELEDLVARVAMSVPSPGQ